MNDDGDRGGTMIDAEKLARYQAEWTRLRRYEELVADLRLQSPPGRCAVLNVYREQAKRLLDDDAGAPAALCEVEDPDFDRVMSAVGRGEQVSA